MTYYILPRTHHDTYKHLTHVPVIETNVKPAVSNMLSHFLSNIKERIHMKERFWDIYKKYTNPYEYIHTIVPIKKKSVAKHKPLSRSYYKMVEILHIFRFSWKMPIQTFHLAEGPGGFIEAIVKLNHNVENKHYGMTLLGDQSDIPAWKKSSLFLRDNPNVLLEHGKTGTGDILQIENFVYVVQKYGSSMDFITADGGFDFSTDFNQQEITIGPLLYAQIAYAVCLQKKGGSFVLKIFDSFMQSTIDLLYFLSSVYATVAIIKPQTSRYANSEKYVVCSGFLIEDSSNSPIYSALHTAFSKQISERYLNIPIQNFFLQKMEEYNAIFGQKQIQNIHYTLSLIDHKNKSEKIEHLTKTNIQKCVDWCIKNGEPINDMTSPSNIFIERVHHMDELKACTLSI